jgi:hypothetical protein
MENNWDYIKISDGNGKRIFKSDIIEIREMDDSYLFTVNESGKKRIYSYRKQHVNFCKD